MRTNMYDAHQHDTTNHITDTLEASLTQKILRLSPQKILVRRRESIPTRTLLPTSFIKKNPPELRRRQINFLQKQLCYKRILRRFQQLDSSVYQHFQGRVPAYDRND